MKTFDLQRFRKDKNLTQKQIAEILDCEQSFISRVEKNSRLFPENMQVILQEKYGDITEYVSEKDVITINASPQEFLFEGADAFSRQVVKMMNDKLIAPYGLLAEKDKEIERLNRQIGKLEAQLSETKKTAAQQEGSARCAGAV